MSNLPKHIYIPANTGMLSASNTTATAYMQNGAINLADWINQSISTNLITVNELIKENGSGQAVIEKYTIIGKDENGSSWSDNTGSFQTYPLNGENDNELSVVAWNTATMILDVPSNYLKLYSHNVGTGIESSAPIFQTTTQFVQAPGFSGKALYLPQVAPTRLLMTDTDNGVIATSFSPNSVILQNGNSFGSQMNIGTNDNFPLVFETNGLSKAQITSTGELIVGLGSVGAGSKIEVTNGTLGTTKVFGSSVMNTGGNNPRFYIEHVTAANSHRVEFNSAHSSGSGFANYCFLNGSVGIGVTAPSTALHVNGATTINGNGDRMISFVRPGGNTISIEHDIGRMYFYNTVTSTPLLNFANGGHVSIGTVVPSLGHRLTVNGSIAATDGNIAVTSDKEAKSDIKVYEYGLSEILKIEPVRFKYKKSAFESVDSTIEYVGIIAQDIEKIMPETISTYKVPQRDEEGNILLDEEGNSLEKDMKSFKGNSDLVYALINSVKELTSRIEALEASLK